MTLKDAVVFATRAARNATWDKALGAFQVAALVQTRETIDDATQDLVLITTCNAIERVNTDVLRIVVTAFAGHEGWIGHENHQVE